MLRNGGIASWIAFISSSYTKKITKISLPANEVFTMDNAQLSGLKVNFTDPEIYSKYSNCNAVTIPSNISLTLDWAFEKLPDYIKYVQVENDNSLVTIDEHAFDWLKLVDVDSSNCNKLTTLARYAFEECTSLAKVKLPSSLSNITDYVFNNCISLESINLPLSLTQIGKYSISSTNLSNVYISQCEKLWTLWFNAFFCKN